jgi:hypothetical protein
MMTERLYGPDVDRFRHTLIKDSKALLDRALAEVDRHESAELLKTLYEVWSLNLGALEGMACLRGVERDLRHSILRTSVQTGKKLLLDEHRKACKQCDGGDQLQQELDELN